MAAQVIIDMEEYQQLKRADNDLFKIRMIMSNVQLEMNEAARKYQYRITSDDLEKIYDIIEEGIKK